MIEQFENGALILTQSSSSKFPSASIIEDDPDASDADGRATSGSALLFRPRNGIACIGAGSKGGDGMGTGIR